jgi:methylated-DNA-[protein]-cysteine S-methyltransferase
MVGNRKLPFLRERRMKHYLTIQSPLGAMWLRAEDDALTGVYFFGQKYFPPDAVDTASGTATGRDADTFTGVSMGKPPRVLAESAEQLAEYFAGERQQFTVRLQMAGSPFQRSVWSELVKIPFGEIESYGRLAQRLGLPIGSARAVGAANGRNPVSIIVPCHRVISNAGELTGYAGGLERKAALLALERPASKLPRQLELLDADDAF